MPFLGPLLIAAFDEQTLAQILQVEAVFDARLLASPGAFEAVVDQQSTGETTCFGAAMGHAGLFGEKSASVPKQVERCGGQVEAADVERTLFHKTFPVLWAQIAHKREVRHFEKLERLVVVPLVEKLKLIWKL